MKLTPNEIYHVYNRGNNKQRIFFEDAHYRSFLRKTKKYLAPYCDILNYSLLPNHFHFMIHANEKTNIPYRRSNRFPRVRNGGPIRLTMFSWGLQQLLSSYSKGINKQFGRTGSLFQQNTKIKQTSHPDIVFDYSLWCFIYIHNNASDAGLVEAAEDYEFSSLHDYIHDNENSICNIELGKKLLCLDMNDAIHKTEFKFPDEVIKDIH